MLKLTVTSAPPQGWTREEWLTHYTERHGPLVAAASPHIYRYTQGPTWLDGVPADLPGHDPRLACLTQVWFRDEEAIIMHYDDSTHAIVTADEHLFCDYNTVILTVGSECQLLPQVLDDGPKRYVRRPRVHVSIFRKAASRISPERLQETWLEERGPGILAHPGLRPHLRGYVQTHTARVGPDVPLGESVHSVVDDFTFPAKDEALAFWRTYRADDDLQRSDAKFTDQASDVLLFWQSHDVIVPPTEE
jgi:hypothetical protein